MPLQATSGAASYDAFGGGVAAVPNYIEDVFSTYLYTGNGSTQTITNGIDLSANGGLTWCKGRSNPYDHYLFDTVRGANNYLISNYTGAQNAFGTYSNLLTSFNTNGFSLGADSLGSINVNNVTYVSWSFAKAPKFFDVVTYTGNGSTQNIAHNLGSEPGCIIVKKTSSTGTARSWYVYHRSLGDTAYINLNLTSAAATGQYSYFYGGPSSTTFTVNAASGVNESGETFVAYIYAHNAGGFGATGTDNVISCGSFTTDGSGNATVTLGYEPQWLMTKSSSTASSGSWYMQDNMRGWVSSDPGGNPNKLLYANAADAEGGGGFASLNATGFTFASGGYAPWANATFIYIAIRRNPMKVPTVGTSVFAPVTITATQATLTTTTPGFPPDLIINGVRSNANYGQQVTDRLRGVTKQVFTEYDSAEGTTNGTALVSLDMTGFTLGADTAGTGWNAYTGYTSVKWNFRRAPSFFDEVCYTGNGAGNNAQTHNLATAPELLIIKNRSAQGSGDWFTFHTFTVSNFKKQLLDTTDAQTNYSYGSFLDAQPTSTTFTVNSGAGCNNSGTTYVAYLFATCAGVSKVGSYTGTGALQTVNCGFTSGARFVLIKRTDSTGDWWTYDSARGISSGNDPYLLLNSAAAEVTSTNYVDTDSTGFKVTAAAPAGLNASGGTYLFLAIA
jgi:hypothetical protein